MSKLHAVRGDTPIDWFVKSVWGWRSRGRERRIAKAQKKRDKELQPAVDRPVMQSRILICRDCGSLIDRDLTAQHKNACREMRRPVPKKPPRGYV